MVNGEWWLRVVRLEKTSPYLLFTIHHLPFTSHGRAQKTSFETLLVRRGRWHTRRRAARGGACVARGPRGSLRRAPADGRATRRVLGSRPALLHRRRGV